MAVLAPGAQLGEDPAIDRVLRIDEALQTEDIGNGRLPQPTA
jgi:hypothetical protein